MVRRVALLVLTIYASTWLQACFVTRETGQLMQDDINALKTDLAGFHKSVEAFHAQETEHTESMLRKLEQLSKALQEFNQSARMTDADFGSQMERMIRDVQDLRGAVEVNEHRLGETEVRMEANITQRIDALAKQTAAAAEANVPERSLPANKKAALALGVRLIRDGKTQEGRSVLRNITKTWPKAVGTTDEAIYRLAETYYEEKKYESALREYVRVVDKFATGAWADDAYYKIGSCSMELGRDTDAQTFFTELVTHHKSSPWVKNAQSRLDIINRRLQKKDAAKDAPEASPAPKAQDPNGDTP